MLLAYTLPLVQSRMLMNGIIYYHALTLKHEHSLLFMVKSCEGVNVHVVSPELSDLRILF